MNDPLKDLMNMLTEAKDLHKPPLQKLFDHAREIQKICATETGQPDPSGKAHMEITEYHTLSKEDARVVYDLANEIISELAEASIRFYEFIEDDLLGDNMATRVQQQIAIAKLKKSVSPEEFAGLLNKAAEDFEKVTGRSADGIREWTKE